MNRVGLVGIQLHENRFCGFRWEGSDPAQYPSENRWGRTRSIPSNLVSIESDPNGTYLSFRGCPWMLTSSRAACLGLVSNGYGFGLRFTARGSILPDR